jgi:hypothetical protein
MLCARGELNSLAPIFLGVHPLTFVSMHVLTNHHVVGRLDRPWTTLYSRGGTTAGTTGASPPYRPVRCPVGQRVTLLSSAVAPFSREKVLKRIHVLWMQQSASSHEQRRIRIMALAEVAGANGLTREQPGVADHTRVNRTGKR